MQKEVQAGRVRTIGVSNFGVRNLQKLVSHPMCTTVPAVNQLEVSQSACPTPFRADNPTLSFTHTARQRGLLHSANKMAFTVLHIRRLHLGCQSCMPILSWPTSASERVRQCSKFCKPISSLHLVFLFSFFWASSTQSLTEKEFDGACREAPA